MTVLFPKGVKGLGNSKWSGALGSVFRMVGLDIHSKPGLIKVQQALAKHSGSTITELCKVAIPVSDGSKLWFSSESGKVWREISGAYTLIHTISSDPDLLDNTFYTTFDATVESWHIGARVQPSGSAFPQLVYSTSGGSTGGSSTLSVSAAVPAGSNRVLVVFVSNIEASADDFSSTLFGGVAMTNWYSGSGQIEGVDTRWALYYLINPTAGTANVVTTWAGSTTNRNMHVMVFTGAHQTTPLGGTVNTLHAPDATSAAIDVPSGASYQTRIAYLISEYATHTQADTQTEALNTVSGTAYRYSTCVVNDLNMGAAIPLGAGEIGGYVYFATEKLFFRIAVTAIASSWSIATNYGYFAIGDDTYHPFTKQNNALWIGDKTGIASVDADGVFTAATEFNTALPERITALTPIDVDILVGTLDVNIGRVLRWDTVSDSWSGQDDILEAGVKAFLRDENYVYALVGDFGKWFFYNGEKLVPYFRMPGDWSPSAKAVVYPNAVGYWNGLPVFGVSNSTGNPVLQGGYSFGSYGKDYSKVLGLDFPISSGEFTGMTIGAIIVDGLDLYISWKGAATVGVDKLNWSAKYASAYIHTNQLIPANARGYLKTLKELRAQYASMPASCDLTMKYDKNYTGSFTTLTSVKDTNLMQKRSKSSINKIGSLECRFDFTVSSNNAPEIENIEYFFANDVSKP